MRTISKYQNTIEYAISTKVDNSGLNQLQSQLRQLELSLQNMSDRKLISEKSVAESRQQLQSLGEALTKAFNPSLGALDLGKFRTEIKNAKLDVTQLATAFKDGGAQGQVALNNLIGQIGQLDAGIKRSSSTLDKMFNTISNTVRWGIVSSGFSQILNSLHQSVDYVKELDDSLTQIMLVTDYSREQMNEYAKSANEAAKALGNTTVGVTNATQVFAQQGQGENFRIFHGKKVLT